MDWHKIIFHPGNEELKRFIELGIVAVRLGIPVHFHVEGVRGTGKTTLIRAAKSRFPSITRVADCLYNCEPTNPHCPDHQKIGEFEHETVPTPFLEVSHSAKVGTLVGSIDLDKLTSHKNPAAALLPGTIPRANRGIIFVDEINRLADTSPPLVDLLLDVMGTKPGRVQIEETGLPTVEMAVNTSVWAASNPDEEPGPLQEIRRQLSDRFDFVIRIGRPEQVETVRAIIRGDVQTEVETKKTVNSLFPVALIDAVDEFISNLYIRFRLESIRGVQAVRLGTQLHALKQGKTSADFADMAAVLPAALRHRLEAPLLQEISEAMKNAAVNQQQKIIVPVKFNGETKESASCRYPALWQGLWQRLSQKREQTIRKSALPSGFAGVIPENQHTEKKTIPVLTGPEESGQR
ncbi:MAG: magnesium chelatase [Dethiobacter sp.]|jgi:magnesium chelatase subunit I|nr:magnesium chelatase [Dethiobacter sp.]MBS3897467.1 magnesium chelatase [Dethiobacter sp.]MBS3983664.1 magnesium chelatase [Dethiobacter sp.]MCL4462864.1 magnesium chelatase [Bacillota bacterium]MCL5993624.1 magnesium chelatase [Bacillota bacterium]